MMSEEKGHDVANLEPTVGRNARALTRYWRSLDELARDEAGLVRLGDEFAPDADNWLDPVSRRNFP